jgi:ATP diphosphatase
LTRKQKTGNAFAGLAPVEKLMAVMRTLRTPKTGCPWDLEQDFKSIAPHTLEETYEVIEAIEAGDAAAMKDELGDLLFQIAFHAQMASEQNLFDFNQVAEAVADKMIERHPHVFGDREANTAEAVLTNWETDKAKKREAAARPENKPLSALDGISTALPSVLRALKLQKRAARTGFDWTDAKDILAKIREEIGELEAEMKSASKDATEDELGDLFFALVNLARRLEIDPEGALRRTNRKFERRFREIEKRLAAQGRTLDSASLDEMEAIWTAIKQEEKKDRKRAAGG